jgi:putative ubiquitin-RnfH superfamily antitoxin RatB of RatAB toxin-antitoxin module
MVPIEIIYIPAGCDLVRTHVELQPGAVVADALQASGLLSQYPEIAEMPVGIFSTQVPRTHKLSPGDRLEIYRPLTMDPKDKRRERARHG